MKECRYCGSKYNESEQECPNCGGKLVVSEQEIMVEEKIKQTDFQAKQSEIEARAEGNAIDTKTVKRNMKIGVGILAGIILLVIIIVLIVGRVGKNDGKSADTGATQEKQAKQQYKTVLEYIENEEYEEALDIIATIPESYKKYDNVLEAREEAVEGYAEEINKKADEYVKADKYSEALALLNYAIEKTGSFQKLIEKKGDVREKCEEFYFSTAEKYAQDGDYEVAIKRLESYEENFGDDAEVDAKKLEYKKIIINNKVVEYETEENYAEGITYLKEQLPSVGNDILLETKYDELCSLYKKQCLNDAGELQNKKEYADALRILDAYTSTVGIDSDVDEMKWECKRSIALVKVQDYIDAKKYAEGITFLRTQPPLVGNDVKVKEKFDELLALHKKGCYEMAEGHIVKKEYDEAIEVMEAYLVVVGSDPEVESKIAELKDAKIDDELLKYEATSDYAQAIIYLKSLIANGNKDEELVAKLENYKTSYRATQFKEAEKAYKEEGYSSAVKQLQAALNVLDNDKEINEKIVYYNSKKPVLLSSIKPHNGGLGYKSEEVTDTLGTSYTEYFYDANNSGNDYAVYFLNNEYGTFSFKYALLSGNIDMKIVLTVKDDETNEVLYTQRIDTHNVEGFEVELDVSDVRFMRIEMQNMWSYMAVMANAQLIR